MFFFTLLQIKMLRVISLISLCLIATLVLGPSLQRVQADAATSARQTLSFDAGWLFLKGDAQAAETPEFNDSAWRKLDVPHDWSIEGPFASDNPTRGSGGF